MQCPQCKSRSLVIKDGQKRCDAKGCTFIEFHVITYENENRQFEGEKGTENRFNSISSGIYNGEKETQKYLKNFERVTPVIKDLIHAMKLSTDLQDRAQSKLIQILRVKYEQKLADSKNKIKATDKDIAAFSLWLACCDKKMDFKDVRIANEMMITKKDWNSMYADLNQKLKTEMTIPSLNAEHEIRRICTKRKINQVEEKAMLEMVARLKQSGSIGGKPTATQAGLVFWQIMVRSATYNGDGKFNIEEYITPKNKRRFQNFEYWTQTEIETSYNTINNFKAELKEKLLSLIPHFKTRVYSNEEKNAIRQRKINE